MAFRTTDFKKTSRKAKGDAPASLYPHQMRDKKTLARLDIAIRLFDQMVGKRKGEMDAGALVDFFGDPRLARGVVACLGQYYQYRAPSFAETIGQDAAANLLLSGLGTPMAVRAHTYAWLNTHADGFVTEAGRAARCAEIAAEFPLSARDWDALMHLDAEENQLLTRPGNAPCGGDIAALYNFHALDTALRRAVSVTLTGLALTPAQANDARKAAERLGAKAAVSGGGSMVTLIPSPADESGKRRPIQMARAALMLMHAHATRATVGHADVVLGTRRFRVALATDAFRALGCPLTATQPVPAARRLDMGDALHRDLLKLRARGQADGWRIKRLPDPRISTHEVLLPDLSLAHNGRSVLVVLGERTERDGDVPTLSLPLGRTAPDPMQVLEQADAALNSLFALPTAKPSGVPQDVRALCDRAASLGLVRAAEAQRALHLLDEEPLIAWVRQAADPRVRYIPGLGLCAESLVSAIQEG